jgi:hypothetical protein
MLPKQNLYLTGKQSFALIEFRGFH